MISTKVPYSRLVALFPHDDFLRPIRAYRSRLFGSGLIGAFSFPACIPLGYANEALKHDQLINLAIFLRLQAENAAGHFHLGNPEEPKYLDEPGFSYIPMRVHPIINELPSGIPLQSFSEQFFILCLADFKDSMKQLIPAGQPVPAEGESIFPLHFRAAFVANLLVWPASHGATGLSFCWERGKSVWLPSPPRRDAQK